MIPHNFWTKRPTIKFLTFLEWELIGLYFLCFTLEDWLLNLSVYEQSLKFSIKKMMKILQKHEKIRRTWVKYLNENCFEEPKVCTFGKALRFFEANFFGTILIFHQCVPLHGYSFTKKLYLKSVLTARKCTKMVKHVW